MRLRLIKEPFDHPDYVYELKMDGFRAITYIQNGECKILSRNSRVLRFPSLSKNLSSLRVEDAIIDGEIISIDTNGVWT
jgi:bifunctional non-homologous end joining protein LigD